MKIKTKIFCSLIFCCVFSFSSFCQNENSEIIDLKRDEKKTMLDSNQQLQLSKQLNELKAKLEAEKKEQMLKLLTKDKEIQTLDLERQKTIRNYFAGGLMIVIVFFVILLYFFRKEKKALDKLKKEHEQNQKILESFN